MDNFNDIKRGLIEGTLLERDTIQFKLKLL